jgi:hypothetical protein
MTISPASVACLKAAAVKTLVAGSLMAQTMCAKSEKLFVGRLGRLKREGNRLHSVGAFPVHREQRLMLNVGLKTRDLLAWNVGKREGGRRR